jgi:threonine synthase
VRAFESGADVSEPWTDADTVAFGINVPKALGDFIVLDALRDTGGTAVAVSDEDLLRDVALAGRLEGMFMSPEGAATVTATRALLERGWLSPDDETVLLNTGAGIVYPGTVLVSADPLTRDARIDLAEPAP